MKIQNCLKKITLSFCLVLTLSNLFSQDKLYKYDGTAIDARVIEVTIDDIKYKKFNYLDGPTMVVSKSEIVMIIYANGERDVFAEENSNAEITKETATNTSEKTASEMFLLGKQDASYKYTSYKPFWGTFVPTIIFAPAGVVVGLIIGGSKPSIGAIQETHPDPKLIVNQDYYNGYKRKMKQKKWGRVWGGFGVGIAVNVVAYYLIVGG